MAGDELQARQYAIREANTDGPGAILVGIDGSTSSMRAAAAARELQADAVIVGRSSRMLHRIAGSLAVKLVCCGRWPVTVVP